MNSNISEYIINFDNSREYSLNTEFNSKEIFSLNKKKNLINIIDNKNLINNYKKDINQKSIIIYRFNSNLKDKAYIKKPLIYHKPKTRISNLKEIKNSSEKESKNKNI